MQTYTHLGIGAFVGAWVAPGDYVAQFACMVGAVAPDLILVPKFILDKLAGKQPFEEQSDSLLLAKEITNSIPMFSLVFAFLFLIEICHSWLVLFFSEWILLGASWSFAFILNYLIHLCIDLPTHCGKEYKDTDPSFFWPFKVELDLGIWEYRYGPGVLKPKPFEALVFALTVLATAVLWGKHVLV